MMRAPCILLTALLVSGCGALSRTTSLKDPLPPPKERTGVGAWGLGDNNCTGSIEAANGRYFWVADCMVKAGYGWCEYGLALEKRTSSEYVNEKLAWSFTINPDGTLTETRKGQLIGHYAVSPTGVCGVRTGEREH